MLTKFWTCYLLAIPLACIVYLLQLRWMGALGQWYSGFVGGFTSRRQIVVFAIKVALFMPAFLAITELGMLVFGIRRKWWPKKEAPLPPKKERLTDAGLEGASPERS